MGVGWYRGWAVNRVLKRSKNMVFGCGLMGLVELGLGVGQLDLSVTKKGLVGANLYNGLPWAKTGGDLGNFG